MNGGDCSFRLMQPSCWQLAYWSDEERRLAALEVGGVDAALWPAAVRGPASEVVAAAGPKGPP